MKYIHHTRFSIRSFGLAALAALGGVACSPPTETETGGYSYDWSYIPPTRHEWTTPRGQPPPTFASKFNEAETSCDGPCPEDVGMLMTFEQNRDSNLIRTKIGRCGTTLVRDDLVQTASHCIPRDIVRAGSGASCSSALGVVFPAANGKPMERVSCASIVYTSGVTMSEDGGIRREDLNKPDYALIRLARKPNRMPTEISREGFVDGRKVILFATHPDAVNSVASVIKRSECEATMGTSFFPEYASPFALNVTVFGQDCRFRTGNSGSSVRDQQGRVMGVLYAVPKYDELQIRVRMDREAYPEGIENFAYVTNLACAELPGFAPPNSGCAGRAVAPSSGASSLSAHRRAEDLLRAQGQRLSPHYGYSLVALSGPDETRSFTEYAFLPKCVMPEERWPAESPTTQLMLEGLSVNGRVRTATNGMHVRVGQSAIYDRRGRASMRTFTDSALPFQYGVMLVRAPLGRPVLVQFSEPRLQSSPGSRRAFIEASRINQDGFRWCEEADVQDSMGLIRFFRDADVSEGRTVLN